jgi:pilus assembly protein Flp/PilA
MQTLTKIVNRIKKSSFVKEEEGAAAVEYGLLVGLIAAVIITTVALLGPQINNAFLAVTTAMTAAGL